MPVRGGLRIYLDGPPEPVVPGCRVRLRAKLRAPRDFGTPGEFAYRRHLLRQGIDATTHLAGSSDLAILAGSDGGPGARVQHWRLAAGRLLDRQLPGDQAVLLRALLIGDQGGIDQILRDRLSACGLSHLFAISGMHLGFIAGFLYLLGRAGYRRSRRLLLLAPPRRFLPLVLVPLLFFYLEFSGASLATSRAFLVAAGAAVGLALCRSLRPIDSLVAAAMALLLWDPLALFEPGLQLSFAGAAGLLLLLPHWLPRLRAWRRVWRWPATLFLASLAATLATLPLSLWHFHRLAPAAPLTNLWAIPLVAGIALPAGLAGLLLAPLALGPAGLLLRLSGAAIQLALAGAEYLTSWPLLAGRDWYPAPLVLTAMALGFFALVLFSAGARRRSGQLLLTGLTLLLGAWALPPVGGLTLTALSVGQGESLLLTLPGGARLLVDGGGSRNPHFDVGRRLVGPALGRLGVDRLRAVLLTHPHPDHYRGLAAVLATFPVGELWVGAAADSLPPPLATLAARRHIPVRRFGSGWHSLPLDPQAELDLYAPPPAASTNDRSLVLYARQGGCGTLLTGDLEAAGIRRLLAHPLPGPVALLKIPHHGSRHSAPMLLLKSLQPTSALVSVGFGNPYDFPDRQLLAAYRRRGIRVWRTDLDGTLRFRAGPAGWRPQHWQNGLFR